MLRSPLLFQLIRQFCDELCDHHRLSERTADAYQYDLWKVCYRLLHDNAQNIFIIDEHTLLRAIFVPEEKRKTSLRALYAVKKFFLFLVDMRFIKYHPIIELKLSKYKDRSKGLPHFLGENDTRLLLYSITSAILNPKANSDYAIRDKAMYELMYGSGMRVSEVISLQLHQIDFTNKSIRVIGKGDKERVVVFGEEAKDALLLYINTARKHFIQNTYGRGKISRLPEWVFIGKHIYWEECFTGGKRKVIRVHKHLGRRMADYLIKKYAYLSGLSKKKGNISCHWLRHSFATHMADNGASLRVVQMLLGHASIGTTQIYLYTAIKWLKALHKKFHPREQTACPQPKISDLNVYYC